MSEEQNDSPAFRLRPRRAAPKSYYTVRLEYSANPAAFIRERPRSTTKRRVFSQKSGSNATKSGYNQGYANANVRPTVVSKEELELEERRLAFHRGVSDSIKIDTMISPFMQRLAMRELEPDCVYEHNHISLKILDIKSVKNRLLVCSCQGVDDFPVPTEYHINLRLYDEYADESAAQPGKIINIAKFRTGPTKSDNSEHRVVESGDSPSLSQSGGRVAHNNGSNSSRTSPCAQTAPTCELARVTNSIKCESIENQNSKPNPRRSTSAEFEIDDMMPGSNVSETIVLPFDVIVKFDELIERSTSNSNRSSPITAGTSLSGGASVNRRLLIPFISFTDTIEQPTEPFVEMCPPSPPVTYVNQDDENQQAKKVKFTANLPV